MQLDTERESCRRSTAVAQARAAQILAEMLGMVCHQEYFVHGEQNVHPSFLLTLGLCRSL
jgi:hypothetical protein